jgi:hypothetical protein
METKTLSFTHRTKVFDLADIGGLMTNVASTSSLGQRVKAG